jgi:signal transduction histidine kinase
VAHTLNNYLAVVVGTIELTLTGLRDCPDAQIRDWLTSALHATEMMTSLTNQLLNAAATEGTQLEFSRIDLPDLVEHCCNYYRQIAERKLIEINMVSSATVTQVLTDGVVVAAIMDNLLSNAVKYSPPGKQISVEIRDEKDSVVCAVSDEGPGLGPEDQARLFQRGARLTPKPTSGEPSTGYGLAVAKELVESLGGTIWCETTLGQGSCFLFRVPVSQ